MAATTFAPTSSATLVARSGRFVSSRPVDREPLMRGELPYEQMVERAFDGPVLRLSQKLKLLELADARHIRRGDALDVIAAIQRQREQQHEISPPSRLHAFLTSFGAFALVYAVIALAWCLIVG